MGAIPQEREDHHRTAADDARRRLLAGVPVTERRLELAAIPTAVLEAGDDPPLEQPAAFLAALRAALAGTAAAGGADR